MSRDVVKVSPSALRWKLSVEMTAAAVSHDEWNVLERQPIAQTDKHLSVVQRYVHGAQWEDTPLFQNIYKRRILTETVRGCSTWAGLVAMYHSRVDALYADMRAHGFRKDADPIPVYLGSDNVILTGNQGNHRLAIAQTLGLESVIVEFVGRHPLSTQPDADVADVEPLDPDLPSCAQAIPAMTTPAERRCYYRLARQQATQGAIVELGTWLGAATAYLAAGVRDSVPSRKVQAYDRFIWKPKSHDKKAGGPIGTTQLKAYKENLGPLLEYVETHVSDVSDITWGGDPIGLLVCDAPKRIPAISSVLSAFADGMRPGSLMAWQDFAYFPSYDIPAAMIRLGDHIEFAEAVYPGTTAVFKVLRPWVNSAVSKKALSLERWTAGEIESAWSAWSAKLPEAMRPRFACGALMFMCDIGEPAMAQRKLKALIKAHSDEVLPKWRYLLDERSGLMERYRPLVEVVHACA